MAARWYVARCMGGREGWAVKNILQQNMEVYWPRFELTRKGTNNVYFKSVFPGYVFVHFDIDKDRWSFINSTFGVRGLLGVVGDRVLALPVGFVEQMIDNSEDGVMEMPDNSVKYKKGEEVRIVDGVLNGKTGIVQYDEGDRVGILLTLIGRESKVVVAKDNLQPTKAVVLVG